MCMSEYCLMCAFGDSFRSLWWHCSAAPTLIGCWPFSLGWMQSHLGTFHSYRGLSLAAGGEIAFLFPYNGWSELDGGKSITVIINTIEANSTATSAILKPSAAVAYQGAPWDQQEATQTLWLRQRFTLIQFRSCLEGGTNQQKSFRRQQLSLKAQKIFQ